MLNKINEVISPRILKLKKKITMKKLFAILVVAAAMTACGGDHTEAAATPAVDSAATTTVDSAAAVIDSAAVTVDSVAAKVDSVAKEVKK